jgi:molybdenum-dependent DNA-binding transcriptional regulator ModE
MSDPRNTLALAQRFRRDAGDTKLNEYAERMLRAARDLEEFASHYNSEQASSRPGHQAG